MPISVEHKIRKIQQDLYKESPVSMERVKDAIKDHAGVSKTTLNTYMEEMVRRGVISAKEEGGYKVSKPEVKDLKPSGKEKHIDMHVPAELVEASRELGLDIKTVLVENLVEEVSELRDYIGEEMVNAYGTYETEFILDLVKYGAYKANDKKEDLRERLYEEYFGDVDEDHLKNLRIKAFELAEKL